MENSKMLQWIINFLLRIHHAVIYWTEASADWDTAWGAAGSIVRARQIMINKIKESKENAERKS